MISFHTPKYPFVIENSSSLAQAVEAIAKISGFPVVVINKFKTFEGIVSSGDIARFLQKESIVKPSECNIAEFLNRSALVGHVNDSIETVKEYLSSRYVRTLPIIDSSRKVVKVILASEPSINIGKYVINSYSNPFLIAEIGVNHNGNVNEAKYLIEEASSGDCDAVKFQHRSQNLYNSDDIDSYDLGTQYIISEIERTRLSINQLIDCCTFARNRGLEVIITPFDQEALAEIMMFEDQFSCLKIASCDLTNHDLINACIKTNKPIILSTGMSYEHEIIEASQLLMNKMCEHAFLHCNSTYPAPLEDINIAYIERLIGLTDSVVGYSAHDGDKLISCLAIAKGAQIIEFHLTRDKDQKGTDHIASIATNEISKFTKMCNISHISRGSKQPRKPSQGELSNRISLGKSYALNKDVYKGDVIKLEDLILLSPRLGYSPSEKNKIIGKKILQDKKARTIITKQDIEHTKYSKIKELDCALKSLKSRGYTVGIPVRYHDFQKFNEELILPLYEFHMSDRDLNLDPQSFIYRNYKNTKLTVHAVEQFEDGFIFDLASSDEDIIKRSYMEINRLNSHVNNLRNFFKDESKIDIIINIGGYTRYNFLKDSDAEEKLKISIENINSLKNKYKDINFLAQTMPPFPWHQGGKSYHNLLTNYRSLKNFINGINCEICFDISHSYLSSNYWSESIYDYINLLQSSMKHIHLSDAIGSNGEGLDLGDGEINFNYLHKELKKNNKHYTLVPEIWQGHINGGRKFYDAIIRYEQLINSVN